MDELEIKKIDYTLTKLLARIKPQDYIPFTYELKEKSDALRVEQEENPLFIPPLLKIVSDYTSVDDIKDARIILIEAVGASGKTELTKNISFQLKCPVVDLGKTEVVGGYSLTGLLDTSLNRKDWSKFRDDLAEGKANLIIDALDEGYMKTNYQGYQAFLKDILKLEPTRECPVILLGRYNAVELAASYFIAEAGVNVATLQIEPFTLQQAEQFIDNAGDRVSQQRHYSIYKETRNYILRTIDGFFKNQALVSKNVSQRFIGYAPVLLSIAYFFKKNNNYKAILDDLQARNNKSVSLIVDIVQRILKRDCEEKVRPQLLNMLLEGRSEEFKQTVIDNVYTEDEQCARVLYSIMDMPFPDIDISDPSFMSSYNDHIQSWIEDHPFMGKKRFNNIVFESYALARLVNNGKYRDTAIQYMRRFRVSYMFAYIYYALYKFDDLDDVVFPFIYDSIRELNSKQNYYTVNLDYNQDISNDDILTFDLEFVGSNDEMPKYEGRMSCLSNEVLDLGGHLEHVNITTPTDYILSQRSVEAAAPSYINCRNLIVQSEEIRVYNLQDKTTFMFECDDVVINQSYQQYLQICGPGKQLDTFKIVCPNQPQYPLIECWTSEESKLKDLTEDVSTKYKKLRSIILSFRSHSKGVLAKYYERIDNIMGNNPVGKAVIDALVEKNVMYRKAHLYQLNPDAMDAVLGLSYDGIRNFEQSDKALEFLRNIVVE